MSFVEYASRDELMNALANEVAAELADAIDARGEARLCVPGGTTPAPFMQALSMAALDWEKVTILLGDERFVPESSDRSNTRLIKENLFQNQASDAQFLSFLGDYESPEIAARALEVRIEAVLPIDVLVVGMGADMHTASLFPDSPDIGAALRADAPALVVIRAENAGEPRLSLSARALSSARHKHVLITGEEKRVAIKAAQAETDIAKAPIRAVIAEGAAATIHFAT